VPEVSPPTLSPGQIASLEKLLKAGFQFTSFEQYARYPAVEKSGFVALLDISNGAVVQFGSMGYHLGGGIGVLIEGVAGKAFVWKNNSHPATPELLTVYQIVRKELHDLLAENTNS
jgi:hypothetical protein